MIKKEGSWQEAPCTPGSHNHAYPAATCAAEWGVGIEEQLMMSNQGQLAQSAEGLQSLMNRTGMYEHQARELKEGGIIYKTYYEQLKAEIKDWLK